MKNWIRFLILLIISFFIALGIRKYSTRRQNIALHLKKISLSGMHKPVQSMAGIKKPIGFSNKKDGSLMQQKVRHSELQTNDNFILAEMKFSEEMKNAPEKSLKAINQSLDDADQILSKDSSNYEVLRDKLILLLIKEQKYNQPVPDEEVNLILEKLVSGQENEDTISRKEASIISVSEGEREVLVNKAQLISEELWLFNNQTEPVDQTLIETRRYELEKIQRDIEDLDQRTQQQLTTNYLQPSDELIEIPLQRSLAKKNYQNVIDDSLELIERFPHSISGYFYLIRALDLNGESETANEIIKQTPLSFSEHLLLQQRLEKAQRVDPADFWQTLL